MKSEKTKYLVTIGFLCGCLLAQTTFGQTIIRRCDFDSNVTWGAPAITLNATANSAVMSGTISPSRPAAATYGAISAVTTADILGNSGTSAARTLSSTIDGSDGTAVLTFPAIAPAEFAGSNDLYISFRLAGYSLVSAGNTGLDQNDEVVVSVSLNNGATFSNEIRVRGNSQSVWNYENQVVLGGVYDGNNNVGTNDYQPSASNSVNNSSAPSKLTLVIPDGNLDSSTGVVFRVSLLNNRTDELWAVDDFIAYTAAPLASQASVGGRVTNQIGSGVANARVSATSPSGRIVTALTNQFGYFHFGELNSGETYIFRVENKKYDFSPQVVTVNDNLTNLHFTATEPGKNLISSPEPK